MNLSNLNISLFSLQFLTTFFWPCFPKFLHSLCNCFLNWTKQWLLGWKRFCIILVVYSLNWTLCTSKFQTLYTLNCTLPATNSITQLKTFNSILLPELQWLDECQQVISQLRMTEETQNYEGFNRKKEKYAISFPAISAA